VTISELHRPQTRNGDGIAITILQGSEVIARNWVEGVDGTIAEIPYQQRVAIVAEEIRRQRNAPWRIEHPIRCQPMLDCLRFPSISNTLMNLFPAPATSSCFALSCIA